MTIFLIPIILLCFLFLGYILNKDNLVLLLLYLELLFFTLFFFFLLSSWYLENILGYIISIYILIISALESALGLSIICNFFTVRGSLSLNYNILLKG